MQRTPLTVIGWPSFSPNAASSSCSTSSMTLPKRSMRDRVRDELVGLGAGERHVERDELVGVHRLAGVGEVRAGGQRGGDGGEDVAAVEGRGRGLQAMAREADVDRLDGAAEARDRERQQAVVGADEDAVVLGGAHGDGEPLAADVGVDDGEVHAGRAVRAARAAGSSAPERTSCRGTPCVRSSTRAAGRDPRDHAVAHADEVVGEPVVGEERDRALHRAAESSGARERALRMLRGRAR